LAGWTSGRRCRRMGFSCKSCGSCRSCKR
jgi:hypothetical protein